MNDRLVSIVVPTFNSARFLPETFASLLKQIHRPLEVVFVDDNSTDNTAELLNGYREEAARANVRVQIVLLQENRGGSAARNLGTQLASGAFCGFLDSDDILQQDKVAIQAKALDANPECDFVYGPVRRLHDKSRFYAERQYGLLEAIILQLSNSRFQSMGPLFRRSFLHTAGRWNERLRTCQDWEYHQRLLYARPRFLHTPKAISYYRLRGQDPSARVSISANDPDGGRIAQLALGQFERMRVSIEQAPDWAFVVKRFQLTIEQQVFAICSFLVTHGFADEARDLALLGSKYIVIWNGRESSMSQRLDQLAQNPDLMCDHWRQRKRMLKPLDKIQHKLQDTWRRASDAVRLGARHS